MQIAYLVHFRGGRDTGIYRKVREHVTEWTRLGHDVGLFVATDGAGISEWAEIRETKRVEPLPSRSAFTLPARERLAASVRRWRPDVVYARHGLAYPGFIRLAGAFPTVIEVNADDLPEFKLTSSWRYAFGRASRSLLLRAAAGFVFVTRELARSPNFASFGKPWVAIGNGIDLEAYPPVPAPSNQRPHLLFIGHPRSPWHGLEHVADLAGARPGWQFDVVGPDPGELRSVPPPNMTFHGRLSGEAYLPLVMTADVAVGTLALYREHLEEASPLKVREYLARGIPTLIGYDDTDFPQPPPFLLRIPNRSDGVASSIGAISEFVERSCGSRVERASITHLHVASKEVTRTNFLHEILAREPRTT